MCTYERMVKQRCICGISRRQRERHCSNAGVRGQAREQSADEPTRESICAWCVVALLHAGLRERPSDEPRPECALPLVSMLWHRMMHEHGAAYVTSRWC